MESTAPTVGALLVEEQVAFDAHDRIRPAPRMVLTPHETVRVTHFNVWTVMVRERIAPPTLRLPSRELAVGKTAVLDPGASGVKQIAYMLTRRPDRTAPPLRSRLGVKVLRPARARIIEQGVGSRGELSVLAQRGFDATIRLARRAITMLATAYTADCGGCSGVTKIGRPAGHGIVAVDPHVIPLGTHLFIPGYGPAIAGDTGSAIQGNRIDLGFASLADAYQFGARQIKVYILQ